MWTNWTLRQLFCWLYLWHLLMIPQVYDDSHAADNNQDQRVLVLWRLYNMGEVMQTHRRLKTGEPREMQWEAVFSNFATSTCQSSILGSKSSKVHVHAKLQCSQQRNKMHQSNVRCCWLAKKPSVHSAYMIIVSDMDMRIHVECNWIQNWITDPQGLTRRERGKQEGWG